ncbi:helix-turn-helix domain-containing protein [Primorskyibacter aestuariivivens]|uniref:winged helix-turn-helix transcriptional regulator n=1 Tax=Primorskyibacter aestuariivivens TaxID=1888912 RepID=UPI002301826A|nr:helix-turn-helix domain-containing protein [Primorskyibacter aestuariivivens]MDA7430531.1 helix-turn-helix domain-containing protein [Primorskyibacter aestuariivivens]
MQGYGQFCPIAKAAEIFCERWTALVIRNLAAGSERFSDIHRGVPHMSATLLTKRLRQLEAEQIVERRRATTGKHWTYHLTERGAEFVPLLATLGTWGRRWSRRDLQAGEMDLGLLTWGLEHCVDPSAFGPGPVTVELTVTDQPKHKAQYWFVNSGGELDFCISHPGHEIDMYLSATLADLIHVYRGDVSVGSAVENGQLEALGPSRLVTKLKDWLNLGPLSEVPPATRGKNPDAFP